MSGTIYLELKDKEQTEIAVMFLRNNSINQSLKSINEAIHIWSDIDLQWAKEENRNMIDWMETNIGKCTIDVNSFVKEDANNAGFEIEDIYEMQTKVLEGLNERVVIEYHAYSSGFDLSDDSLPLPLIKRITKNGKLLSYTDEFRVLYSQLLEDNDNTVNEKKRFSLDNSAPLELSSKMLIREIKAKNEDFEFYPTTKEIIEAFYWDIKKDDICPFKKDGSYHKDSSISLLDIGAGNAKLFKTIEDINREQPKEGWKNLYIRGAYAIEKSATLIESYDESIFVIGTDFYQQTLIDKEVDIIFSNPPYSDFTKWSEKIIKEANAKVVYLVIPDRWEKDLSIARAIEQRKAKVEIIGNYDFLNSEDRVARAKVTLVKITIVAKDNRREEYDPFDIWFNEAFKTTADKSEDIRTTYGKRESESQRIKNLVKGESLIPRLEELYNEELQHLMNNYQKVADLDYELLKELNVSKDGLIAALKMKVKGLKHLYWQELFDNLDTITSKLTSKSRKTLLGTLTSNTSVDFTTSNAYAVVIWAIKNANQYYDSQLLSLYYSFSNSKNIKNYKSNKRLVEDGWRYESSGGRHKHFSHYSLDYRIVVGDYWSEVFDFDFNKNIRGLKDIALTSLLDLFTVARNLGFSVARIYHEKSQKMLPMTEWQISELNWQPGKNQLFNMKVPSPTEEGAVRDEVFVEVKAFKNGNMHYRFAPMFMKALNLEAARLNMWIKSPKEASEEFDISEEEASELFRSNLKILPVHMTNLLPQNIQSEEETDFDTDLIEESMNIHVLKPNLDYKNHELKAFASGKLF